MVLNLLLICIGTVCRGIISGVLLLQVSFIFASYCSSSHNFKCSGGGGGGGGGRDKYHCMTLRSRWWIVMVVIAMVQVWNYLSNGGHPLQSGDHLSPPLQCHMMVLSTSSLTVTSATIIS